MKLDGVPRGCPAVRTHSSPPAEVQAADEAEPISPMACALPAKQWLRLMSFAGGCLEKFHYSAWKTLKSKEGVWLCQQKHLLKGEDKLLFLCGGLSFQKDKCHK